MNHPSRFVVSIALAGASLIACSSDDTAPAAPAAKVCAAYQVPAGLDLMSPAVKFRTDVVPILSRSCAFSSCHGGKAGGLTINMNDLTVAHGALVGPSSKQLATMPLIAPGDPANSYTMRKMDDDACLMDAQCKNGKCGELMPKNGDVLDIADRDTFRRWIAQGAKDD